MLKRINIKIKQILINCILVYDCFDVMVLQIILMIFFFLFILQWQRNNISLCYVIYRIIIAVTFFTAFVLSIVDLDNINKSAVLRAKWLIYLTNWHYTCCTFQSMLSAFMVTRMYRQVRHHGGKFKH